MKSNSTPFTIVKVNNDDALGGSWEIQLGRNSMWDYFCQIFNIFGIMNFEIFRFFVFLEFLCLKCNPKYNTRECLEFV